MKRALSWRSAVALAGILPAGAEGFVEDFASDPTTNGWQAHGATNLFAWEAAEGRVKATWDSSRPNSYLARPLPFPLGADDDFSFAFDLVLESHAVGVDPLRPSTFQIAAGMIRLADATAPGYVRGRLPGPRNTAEWTWFGTAGPITASVSPAIIPSDGRLPWGYADSFVTLETGVRHRFEFAYTAAGRTARLRMWIDGEPGPALAPVVLPANFTGFTVDAFAVSSYSELGQHPLFGGSVLAVGRIDDIVVTCPAPPIGRIRALADGAAFRARPGWRYSLEASGDLSSWGEVAVLDAATEGDIALHDPRDAVFAAQFYRVKATWP